MSARPRLGLSVDGVAALRQARRSDVPDPVEVALAAERAGVDHVCAHVWQDRRHVQDRDLEILRRVVKTELNIYLAPSDDQIEVALALRPDTVTLVAEPVGAVDLEGGLDLIQAKDVLQRPVRVLAEAGLRVSAVVDDSLEQVRAAHRLGFHAVELFSGAYGVARGYSERSAALARIRDAAKTGQKLGLGVAASHGITLHNVAPLARIVEIMELNVGHALVASAMVVGIEQAVQDFLRRMTEGRFGLPR